MAKAPKKEGAKSALRFSLLPIIDRLPLEITLDLELNTTVQGLAKKSKYHFIESYSGRCTDSQCFVCKIEKK